MGRRSTLLAVAITASLVAGVPAAPPSASAAHGKNCGIVAHDGGDFRARAIGLRCKKARRAVKRYLRSQEPLPGFDCSATPGETPFYCANDERAYWAQRL